MCFAQRKLGKLKGAYLLHYILKLSPKGMVVISVLRKQRQKDYCEFLNKITFSWNKNKFSFVLRTRRIRATEEQ